MARKRQNGVGQVSQILISGHAVQRLLLGKSRHRRNTRACRLITRSGRALSRFCKDGDASFESGATCAMARSGWVSAPTIGASFVSTTFAEVLTGRAFAVRVWKYTVRRVLFPLCVLAPFAYFFPKIALFYAVCGAYDVGRNSALNLSTLRRYFIGNGFPTWILSPFNILLDLLSLPYVNKSSVICRPPIRTR
jgi:hypothetical protein